MLKNSGVSVSCIIQVGDFGFWNAGDWPLFESGEFTFLDPVIVIPGNHEDPKVALPYTRKGKTLKNLRAFQDPCEIIIIDGVTIMGIGGAACVDNPSIRYPYDPDNFTKAIKYWEDMGKPKIDLMVTHEAPTGTGEIGLRQFGDLSKCGVPELTLMWKTIKPVLQCNGHYHKFNTYYDQELDLMQMTLPVAQDFCILVNTETMNFERIYLN